MQLGRKGQVFWFVALYLAVAASVLAAAVYYYFYQVRSLRRDAVDRLTSVLELKVQEMAGWRTERLADAEIVKHSAFFMQAAREAIEGGENPAGKRLLSDRAELYLKYYGYSAVLVVDEHFNTRFATGGASPLLKNFGRHSLVEAVRGGGVYFADFHLHDEDRAPFLGLFVTVSDALGSPIGSIVLQIDPKRYLYPFIQAWPVPSESAETILVRREGDSVLFLNELRHREGTALALRFPLSDQSLPAAMAVEGKEGVFEGRDHRGEKVLAALKGVPGSPWFMIAKIDEEEVFAPLHRLSLLLLFIVVSTFAAGAAAGVLLFKRQRALSMMERRAFDEHYHSFSRYAADAIFLVDERFLFREVNERACEAYGYTRSELLSMGVLDLHFGEERERAEKLIGDVIRRGSSVFESRHRRKDGSALPVEISVRSMEVEGRRWYQAIARDITDRKELERELRRDRDFLNSIGEIAKVGGWEVDLSTMVQRWTPETYRIHGLEPDAPVDLEKGLSFFSEKDRQTLRGLVERAAREGKPYDVALSFVAADGRHLWVRAKGAAVYDGEKIVGIRGIIQDITGQKESEKQLEKYAERMEQMVDERTSELEKARAGLYAAERLSALGRLGAGIAHQFNTPIGAGMLYTDALLECFSGVSEQRSMLEKIRGLFEDMKGIVESMLSLARVRRRDQQKVEQTDINAVIGRVMDMAAMECGARDIQTKIRMADGLPQIKAGAGDLEQIFVNLVTNALDSMSAGGKLTIESAAEGEGIVVRVADTGSGIRPEEMERIFEPFFTTRKGGKGTGLGLSIAREMAERYGGRIEVESRPGHGTVFSVYLSPEGLIDENPQGGG